MLVCGDVFEPAKGKLRASSKQAEWATERSCSLPMTSTHQQIGPRLYFSYRFAQDLGNPMQRIFTGHHR